MISWWFQINSYVFFHLWDESFQVIAILDRLKAEKEGMANEDEEFDLSNRSQGDQDTEGDDVDLDDDDDDGIIYVDWRICAAWSAPSC